MISDYLQSDEVFSHIMMLDAHVALLQHSRNILADIATVMESSEKLLFLTYQDWLPGGGNRISRGLVFVENTHWAQTLFTDMLSAHLTGPYTLQNLSISVKLKCIHDSTACFNRLLFGSDRGLLAKTALGNGTRYNRLPCTTPRCMKANAGNTNTIVLHAGDSELMAMQFPDQYQKLAARLCDNQNYTGVSLESWACSVDGFTMV